MSQRMYGKYHVYSDYKIVLGNQPVGIIIVHSGVSSMVGVEFGLYWQNLLAFGNRNKLTLISILSYLEISLG